MQRVRKRIALAGALLTILYAQSPAWAQTFTSFPANAGTLGPIPDNNPAGRDVTFNVTGMPHVGEVAVSMTFNPPHTWAGDLVITLFAPDGTSHVLSNKQGSLNDLVGPYVFRDDASVLLGGLAGTPIPAGNYLASAGLLRTTYGGRSGNGTWTLRFVDTLGGDTGTVSAATVSLAPSVPTNLRVDNVVGNQVQLRWDKPAGVTPTGYTVDGGVVPGVPIASFATGSAAPLTTFSAPTGSFWVRVRFNEGASLSPPSTDVPLIVNMPVPPSAPTSFTGVVAGSTLNLAWKNTFTGAPPTGLALDVTGAAITSVPLGLTDSIGFGGVAPGIYTLRLRAVNATGTSAATSPVVITVPTACGGAPSTPINFLFYSLGNTVYLIWDPPASGFAPSSYRLDVTGSYIGALAVAGRVFSTAAPPGTYTITVSSVNACGASAPSASQTVTIP